MPRGTRRSSGRCDRRWRPPARRRRRANLLIVALLFVWGGAWKATSQEIRPGVSAAQQPETLPLPTQGYATFCWSREAIARSSIISAELCPSARLVPLAIIWAVLLSLVGLVTVAVQRPSSGGRSRWPRVDATVQVNKRAGAARRA